MPVSLTTAKPGDRFEARDGEIWVFDAHTEKWSDGTIYRCHCHRRGVVEAFFTGSGRKIAGGYDLIRALEATGARQP